MSDTLANKLIGVVIAFIIVFFVVGGLAATLISAATQISGSGLPLATLFASGGVIFVIFMIFLFVGLYKVAKSMGSGSK